MKLTINTPDFQELIAKANKGVGNNRMIPITSLIKLEVKNNDLTVVTTDGINYLYLVKPSVGQEDFYAVIEADKFVKLVSLFNSDVIELEVKDNALRVKCGKGKYDFPLIMNDDGSEIISYPDPEKNFKSVEEDKNLRLDDVRRILDGMKYALAKSFETPCYANYFIGDGCLSTDSYKVAYFNKQLLNKNNLINPATLELIPLLDDDYVTVSYSNKEILFKNSCGSIVAKKVDGLNEYQSDVIKELANADYPSSCTIGKADFVAAMSRISLFVDDMDENAVEFVFGNDGLVMKTKNSASDEKIPYTSSNNVVDFDCQLDYVQLTSCVKSSKASDLTIMFGNEGSVKLVDGDMIHIMSCVEDL